MRRICQSDECDMIGGLGAAAGGGPDQGAPLCPARIIRPRLPPSTWARCSRRDERQGQHSTRRAQMLLARHHLRACARTCRSLRHRRCSTMWPFEARLHKAPGHCCKESRCASRSRERTMACFLTSRLRVSPIPSLIRTRKRTVRCVSLPAWSCASRYVDVAASGC